MPKPLSRRKFCLGFFCLALIAAPTNARAQQNPRATGLAPAALARIEEAVRREMSGQKIPGLSVAVVTRNKLRWSSGFGVSDLENQVPARAHTVYRLASISKPITAVALMQLVEQGKVDLNAPVQKYVPSFPEKPWPVTSRLLLGHLAGIRHYQGDEANSTRYYPTLTEGLSLFKDDPLLHEPGTKYAYTSYGFNLLGCAVEGASGKTFMQYLQEAIFQPAGMDRIREDSVAAIIPHRAQGYRKNEQGELLNSRLADTSYKIPGGGLCSTVEDLARFAIALHTGKLLKQETREQMWVSQRTTDGKPTNYGFGWGIALKDGKRYISHNGGQQRVSTRLLLLPDQGVAVALMSNLEGARLNDLSDQIVEAVLNKD